MSADLIFHQEYKVNIKFHDQIQLIELSGLPLLAVFLKPIGNPLCVVWGLNGALVSLGMAVCGRTYMVLK